MLSERRDEDAATAFFKQAINNNGFPDKVVMDKSGANYAGLANINREIRGNYLRIYLGMRQNHATGV
jgi:transposase-like protein